MLLLHVGLLMTREARGVHEGLVAGLTGVGLGLRGGEAGLGVVLLLVMLQLAPPTTAHPVGLLVSRQA